ncbi:MAG TPA: ring-cleaving dioxygenase [Gemmatimonadota bacterium]
MTAVAGDPQANVDFYTGTLGLRLVKRTVNFDDPTSYHLYYGDTAGSPGSLLTFFLWPGAPRGRRGTAQVGAIALAVPQAAMDFWVDRLASAGIDLEGPVERLGETVLGFDDPDGMRLELVGGGAAEVRADGAGGGPRVWDSVVPAESAIRRVAGVTLFEQGFERTAEVLTAGLDFRESGTDGSRVRFVAGAGETVASVDVLCLPDAARGRIAAGTVHHVAWRVPNDAAHRDWRERVAAQGLDVTPIIDRQYFRSIYFREPGGVLFEVATDPPGMTVDEPLDALGGRLTLPPWYEPRRDWITDRLPRLRAPSSSWTPSPSRAPASEPRQHQP